MTHEKYWDYLAKVSTGVDKRFPVKAYTDDERLSIFKLTVSPYHYWLQNQATLAPKPPQESSVRNERARTGEHPQETEPVGTTPSLNTEDSSNLADKAQEIRSKARTSIRVYMKTCESQWPADATSALMALAADWGPGKTVYRALDLIPDRELCLWNDEHEVFT